LVGFQCGGGARQAGREVSPAAENARGVESRPLAWQVRGQQELASDSRPQPKSRSGDAIDPSQGARSAIDLAPRCHAQKQAMLARSPAALRFRSDWTPRSQSMSIGASASWRFGRYHADLLAIA